MFDYSFDYHVHMGQFQNIYYNPYKIVNVLLACGVEGAYVTSTTSCIKWNTQKEKELVVEHIKAEINELLLYSKTKNFDARPMCWIIPQRFYDGETVEKMFFESNYYGFKIHPRAHEWNLNDSKIILLLSEVCQIAEREKVPVLIHTGICEFESANKFEYWFKKFPGVRFILAHCRDVDEIMNLFDTYENLYGDVAFSTPCDLRKILKSKHKGKLLFGTDFPVTIYCQDMDAYTEKELYKNYKEILIQWSSDKFNV